jgi:ABC-type multidrug transport system ATPase subunit
VSSFVHQGVSRLSAGQSRRTALVAGLIGDPWLLVLDEPTIGLDVEGMALLREIFAERRQAGQATLLVAHEPWLAADAGADVYDLRDGGLVPSSVASAASPRDEQVAQAIDAVGPAGPGPAPWRGQGAIGPTSASPIKP